MNKKLNIRIKIKPLVFSIISGLLAAASFPKINLFFLIWIAFIPLIYAVRNEKPKESFFYGLIAGIVFFACSMYWLAPMLEFNLGSIILALISSMILWFYLALYWGIWALSLNWFSKFFNNSIITAAALSCLWVLLEYVRTYLLTGLPWVLAGYSQYEFREIIQIAEWTGIYGVSFLILFCNFLFYFGLTKIKNRKNFFIAGILLIFSVSIFGAFRLDKFKFFGDEIYKAVIIQPSIDQYKKWDADYRNEIRTELELFAFRAGEKEADIVLWPESVVPSLLSADRQSYPLENALSEYAGGLNIIGALFRDQDGKDFNAVLSFMDGSKIYLQIHKKNHLVPFGEYVPFRKVLAPFFGVLNQMGDLERGNDKEIFRYKSLYIGTLICSENFYPDIARDFVLNGAKVLTNHTNDAWFFKTAAPHQHFIMNVFRAIETRKTILISANSGVSGAVEASGKIIYASAVFEAGIIPISFIQNDYKTFYVKYGDVFVLVCGIIFAICLLFVLIASRGFLVLPKKK
ncbi:MAG: apolipoprotein N-acyltransferase [Elusimicrobiota bacterium]|jgi:apolipoprotein N-acyltransferase|nr:apolipoprotein N-acyltransferase [Elusimicrobiota bacterium]